MKINGTARRLRGTVEPSSDTISMGTVVCAKCGQRFAIRNEAALHTAELAEKQMAWVEEQLVWDHIQERKHSGTMDLPDLAVAAR